MRGRAALAGAAGLLGGAALGPLAALAFVYLWHNVLSLPPLSDDPKPGITMLGGVVPIATIAGAMAGAADMIRRARQGKALRGRIMVFAAALALILAGLIAIIS